MSRWRHFVGNIGWGNALKTAFVGLIALVIAVACPERPYSILALLVAAVIPALMKNRMADRPEFWSQAIQYGGLGLMGAAFLAGYVKDKIEQIPGSLSLLVALMTLYVSAFFWLWSDARVVREDSSTGL